ncbi:MAG: DUF1552 domain-containing protein [Polyangiales bacterium]|nr:DUF1552 domain-containing protein [Myxococcales bacterium]
MSQKLARRRFLQALGLGAAALGLPAGLTRRRARAAGEMPLRIVFYYDSVGFRRGLWEPRGVGGAPEPTETAWELGPLLAPLERWKSKMLALEGLDMMSHKMDPTGAGNAHKAGQTSALTAAFRLDADTGGGPSIDQAIARHIHRAGQVTRLTSLEVAIREWGDLSHAGNYRASGEPVPFLVTPPEVYDRVFPAELRTGDAARQAARRSAIFDLIRSDGAALVRDLPAEGRLKVEQHMDTRAALEARLALGAGRDGNVPDPSIVAPWGDVTWRYQPGAEMQARIWATMADLNLEMTAAALHADVTRVATVNVSHAANDLWGYTNGVYDSSDWHDFVHKTSGATPNVTDPAAQALLQGMHAQSIESLARFLEMLESRLEPDGTTLLDNTIVVLCSELSEGSHDLTRLPWHVIGDAQGQWRTGRYLQFPRLIWRGRGEGTYAPRSEWQQYNQHGRAHNDLFVSLLNAFGAETDTFGEASVCTGPIAEFA